MITEFEFEDYVREIGFTDVDINEMVNTMDGLDIIREYLEDHNIVKAIPLREVYNAIPRIIDSQNKC